jgi:hypothetical protein
MVIFFFLLSLFLVFNWFFKSLLLLFIAFIFYKAHKEYVKRISFYEEGVEVIHVFGYKQFFYFDTIKSFNEHRVGFLTYDVIRVRLRNNKKKIAFYCPSAKRKEFDGFLQSKGYKVKPQV